MVHDLKYYKGNNKVRPLKPYNKYQIPRLREYNIIIMTTGRLLFNYKRFSKPYESINRYMNRLRFRIRLNTIIFTIRTNILLMNSLDITRIYQLKIPLIKYAMLKKCRRRTLKDAAD